MSLPYKQCRPSTSRIQKLAIKQSSIYPSLTHPTLFPLTNGKINKDSIGSTVDIQLSISAESIQSFAVLFWLAVLCGCVSLGSLVRRLGVASSRSRPRPASFFEWCSVCANSALYVHTTIAGRWECDPRGRLKSRYNAY
ncbi:unnamed protein product [Pieris brassicae]|uniref:Uncharacterized protein n=1 Tax=Pieris brassicae TaxID=7116 RepID=A0A9P0XHA5_PIEBR|nr:unnamed protein product [Pieris brassicae]